MADVLTCNREQVEGDELQPIDPRRPAGEESADDGGEVLRRLSVALGDSNKLAVERRAGGNMDERRQVKLTQELSDEMLRSALPVPPAALSAAIDGYDRGFNAAFEEALRQFDATARSPDWIQHEWLRRYSPDNWDDLDASAGAVINLVLESGIPIVWVPRAEIVDALIVFDQDDRYRVLARSSGDILDDLDVVLDRARGANVHGHADACEFAAEAIATARDKHWNAAQALAASGLGQVLHGMFGYPLLGGLGAARKKFSTRDVQEATMRILKVSLLERCTVGALTDIKKARPEPFNRHGTQHGERKFFSKANALTGLLLLVGWIREFTWIAEKHPEVLDRNADDQDV